MKEIYLGGGVFSKYETVSVSYYGITSLFDTPGRWIATSRGSRP